MISNWSPSPLQWAYGIVMIYSSSRGKSKSLAFPSSIADSEFPLRNDTEVITSIAKVLKSLYGCIWTAAWNLHTIKFGFGQNASTNAESIFLIADVEGWNRRVMRNLKVQKWTAYQMSLSVSTSNRDCSHVYIVCTTRQMS